MFSLIVIAKNYITDRERLQGWTPPELHSDESYRYLCLKHRSTAGFVGC
jgi:hypothetical protein